MTSPPWRLVFETTSPPWRLLQVVCGDRESPELDYGVLVGGTSVSLPLHLANHGLAELPLRLNIAAVSARDGILVSLSLPSERRLSLISYSRS